MKTSRDIANEIVRTAIDGNIDRANAMLGHAATSRREGSFRLRSAKYFVAAICLAIIFIGIDALDGKIIDHL